MKKSYSEDEIKDALNRSGYLLENRALKAFHNLGFFAESNHYYKVKDSDEYREIDILATTPFMSISLLGKPVSVFLTYIVECKNINQPLGLFKNNRDLSNPDSILKYEIINPNDETREELPFAISAMVEKSIFDEDDLPSRQFCGFEEKKSKQKELMAYHPNAFYESLKKLSIFTSHLISSKCKRWEGIQPDITRIEIFIPLVIIQGEILLIDNDEVLSLHKRNKGKLKIPFGSYGEEPLCIDVLCEEHLENGLSNKMNVLSELFKELESSYT